MRSLPVSLNSIAHQLPTGISKAQRPRSRQGAHQAIIGPAQLAHEAFQLAPFRYREQAVDEIVGFLGKKRLGREIVETDAVEPVHLQLICRHVEEQVLERQAAATSTGCPQRRSGSTRHVRKRLGSTQGIWMKWPGMGTTREIVESTRQ